MELPHVTAVEYLQDILPLSSEQLQWKANISLQSHNHGVAIFVINTDGPVAAPGLALLFQAAISHVNQGNHVTFICREPLKELPLSVHGMPHAQPALLQQLRMLYLSGAEELIGYLSSVHQMAALPEVLIVEDLHHYAEQMQGDGIEKGVAKLCALLLDTAAFLQHKCEAGKKLHLVASLKDVNKSHLQLYQRFLKQIWRIKDVSGDGKDLYELLPLNIDSGAETIGLTFQVKDALFLHQVVQYTAENS